MKIYLIERTATNGEKFTDEFTDERIKRAFNFGNGTEKNFLEFINNNKNTIRLIDTYNIN